jgi:regulator of protease activity HflC (stomatin/prohibitin superfamily)
MFGLILGIALIVAAISIRVVLKNTPEEFRSIRTLASTVTGVLGVIFALWGSVSYNDAGYCQHVRTIFGNETATCETGWYFSGWGNSTSWPHFITVAHTADQEADGSAIYTPYPVRLADNWNGMVTQTTRFGIPQDQDQFLKMARDFRSPERLISTVLKPAVTSSLDSVSNMYTMEEYWAAGKRDEFKSEFADAVLKGRAEVVQISLNRDGGVIRGNAAPSDSAAVQDTSVMEDTEVRTVRIDKVKDSSGNDVRIQHDYTEYGIIAASAILENLDPDDKFEERIQARKDAASRRIIAQEERREQEEQRLLAIQKGETDIAVRQAAAKTEQIQATTEAETKKQLALIEAERMREEAEIAKQTAEINLERAKVDAQAVTVAADAEAYAKQAILEADGALAQKLAAWTEAQRVWADAAAKINVPATVIAGGTGSGTAGNALGTVEQFMNMLMVKTAKDLAVDPAITNTPVK